MYPSVIHDHRHIKSCIIFRGLEISLNIILELDKLFTFVARHSIVSIAGLPVMLLLLFDLLSSTYVTSVIILVAVIAFLTDIWVACLA